MRLKLLIFSPIILFWAMNGDCNPPQITIDNSTGQTIDISFEITENQSGKTQTYIVPNTTLMNGKSTTLNFQLAPTIVCLKNIIIFYPKSGRKDMVEDKSIQLLNSGRKEGYDSIDLQVYIDNEISQIFLKTYF